ncbi:MAG: hypothetical protein NXI04_01395 [Planctomycetaceae bacterium]|nr:hypothetical protein [Planctomycetaceae bacterium]
MSELPLDGEWGDFDIRKLLQQARQKLSASQAVYVARSAIGQPVPETPMVLWQFKSGDCRRNQHDPSLPKTQIPCMALTQPATSEQL